MDDAEPGPRGSLKPYLVWIELVVASVSPELLISGRIRCRSLLLQQELLRCLDLSRPTTTTP